MTDVRHANYLAQLHEAAENYVNVRRIGQKHHRVFTVESVKRVIVRFDDKRYLLPDGIHTLAHGHTIFVKSKLGTPTLTKLFKVYIVSSKPNLTTIVIGM